MGALATSSSDTPNLDGSTVSRSERTIIPAMGLLTRAADALRAKDYSESVSAAMADDIGSIPLASPWSEPLPSIVWRDLYGDTGAGVVTRGSAMRLGPIRRGRNFIVSTLSGLPLVSLGLGERVPAPEHYATRADYVDALTDFHAGQPSWLYRSDDGASPQHRMAWTVDDLIFHPASLWERRIGSDRFPLDARRVNRERWTINSDNRVEIDGQVCSDEEVILIPGLTSGILVDGVDILRDARALAEIVRKRLRNPSPTLNLQQTGGEDLNTEERRELIEGWATARAGENSGVAFSNRYIKPEEMGGQMDAQLMIEGRNASAVDQARLVGVSASKVDASGVNSTLTYETTQGRNQESVDFDLTLYTLPIEARLSMDDCVPRGRRVRFDRTDLTTKAPSPTGAEGQD